MIEEGKVKFLLYVSAFLTFASYTCLLEGLPLVASNDFLNATQKWYKLFSFVVSSIFGVIFIGSFGLAKIIMRKKYIGGKYRGESTKIAKDGKVIDKHFENVEIIQSLISLKIVGESRDQDNNLYAQWEGFAIKSNLDTSSYEFFAKIKTNTGEHNGFFEFIINDGRLSGFHPGRDNRWRFELSYVAQDR